MKRWFVIWVVIAVLCGGVVEVGAASSSDYLVSGELSAVSFTVYKFIVLREEGRFRDIAGHLHYDPRRPQDSTVDITVNTASLDTSIAERDEHLRSDDFFDVPRYPTMTFASRRVVQRPDKRLTITGDLTIHGITKVIDVIATVNGINDVEHVGRLAGFETTFHIDRTAFGVNGTRWSGGQLVISRDVEVHLAIAAAGHAVSAPAEAAR